MCLSVCVTRCTSISAQVGSDKEAAGTTKLACFCSIHITGTHVCNDGSSLLQHNTYSIHPIHYCLAPQPTCIDKLPTHPYSSHSRSSCTCALSTYLLPTYLPTYYCFPQGILYIYTPTTCSLQYLLLIRSPGHKTTSPMLGNINNLAGFIPNFFHQTPDLEEDMASPPSDSRRAGIQRRDSSRSTGGRRPQLLRSSATEPSITTSTASRNALATPGSSRRATDMLNQVAMTGSPPAPSSPLSQSPTLYDSPDRIVRDHVNLDAFRPHLEDMSDMAPSSLMLPRHADSGGHPADSGRYFSFPSFDAWHTDHPEEEREPEMQMQSP